MRIACKGGKLQPAFYLRQGVKEVIHGVYAGSAVPHFYNTAVYAVDIYVFHGAGRLKAAARSCKHAAREGGEGVNIAVGAALRLAFRKGNDRAEAAEAAGGVIVRHAVAAGAEEKAAAALIEAVSPPGKNIVLFRLGGGENGDRGISGSVCAGKSAVYMGGIHDSYHPFLLKCAWTEGLVPLFLCADMITQTDGKVKALS